ncbi:MULTISPECIES: endopeptidase La [Psychrilyobacter]|uniref:Lon protease n=1 Tax=Psychrilyobacter piezotolerans TaxID=2293438 RepID=A0ABX9KFV4_9FUSO|nr:MULTISPECIES: endopeptidase La [Psychrilyobacter]MCS5421579.1 endopeptidase La [Psychrilyobacter sp. S5]NDI78575.1 endopeptidase La [Psychrilyobacter piezotolerans]RDE60330.1 endopeptidase La [Psychrilyobacter sp. S5]REI40438.1 endopeptidase La [Psychrilyobacter piezotolerans]
MTKITFIPTRDLVVFPGAIMPLYIGREKSVNTLEKSLSEDSKLILCMQKDFLVEEPNYTDDIHKVGVEATILQTVKMPNNTVKVLVEASHRIILDNVEESDGIIYAESTAVEAEELEETIGEAVVRRVLKSFERYAKLSGKILPDLLVSIKSMKDIDKKFDLISGNLNISSEEKQKLLEIFNLEKRGYKLIEILKKELEILNLEKKIENKVKEKMNAAQRAYFLKEKLNAIKEELGEDESDDDDILELKKLIKAKKLPKEVKKKVEKEISKLSKMPAFSAEASVVRNYVETVLDLPWNKKTKDILDIKKAHDKLEEDHYGLKEIKERILEYLAVKKLNPNMKGTILCLVGPPGVGKTSLAKSVADAMGRTFARISLGGVRDESEIRGHRRTYIGSMPGKLIKAMKQAKTKNPLILLDEIDKMSNDAKGDPSSAMLEVLDPEQNKNFEDHYLDMPFDLSNVFFIATANDLRGIPGPLRDRMEIIDLSSYTEFEKMHIAKKYLLDEAQEDNGLSEIDIKISDDALLRIINEYTREAGVRNLKREIHSLYRKLAKLVLEKNRKKITITVKNLETYIGKVKYRPDKIKEKKPKLGVVTGLAWTSVGGTTLEVQSVSMKGKGKILLTGKLGDVMKESAHVAYSYVRSVAGDLEIDEKFNETTDVHLHFPEGAVPKDGPSAGVTITTALISVLTKRKIRQDIAMTGEITITGEVLAVGGIKEKVIGAHRIGIHEVILPLDNESDVDELPKEVKKDMTIHFAKTYEDVKKIAFEK